MKPTKQIIALGGGGFSDDPSNLALDQYILDQNGKERPSACFLATASGDAESYRYQFYEAFSKLECRPSHLSLFQPHTSDLADFIFGQDIIYVGGGNTKSLLALWREWNLDAILRSAYESGVIMAGLSAGAICWFEQGITDSIPKALGPLECLGFLPGSCCPHYDSDEDRRPSFHGLLKSGNILPGYGIDDWAGLHFVDGQLLRAVSTNARATAYSVSTKGNEVIESRLEPEMLSVE
jgi:dipeptidase E